MSQSVVMHGLVRPGALPLLISSATNGTGIALDECVAIETPQCRSFIAGGDYEVSISVERCLDQNSANRWVI